MEQKSRQGIRASFAELAENRRLGFIQLVELDSGDELLRLLEAMRGDPTDDGG